MKFQSLAVGGVLAGVGLAAPLETRQSANIDITILQFALTLEHLENVFYHGALQKFSQQDFINAGYSADYYNNLKYISYDEQSHVQLLTSAIAATGTTPVAACQYKFPYTDVRSFITLSSVLEGVGTSAYLAGAPLITSKQYLTVAGSILVTEALHTSMQRGAISEVPMANPYGTPLDPMSVYTLAASFITTCPTTNPPLGFTPFPSLSYTNNCTCEEPQCSPPSVIVKRDEWSNYYDPSETSSTQSSTKPAESTTKSESTIKSESTTKSETTTTKSASATSSASTTKATTMATTMSTSSASKAMTTSSSSTKATTTSASTTKASTTMSQSACVASPMPTYASCVPPSAGATITLTASDTIPAGSYVTFISGLSVVSVQGTISGKTVKVVIPSIAMGQTYALITKSDVEGALVDSQVLFGPAIVEVNPAAPAIDYTIV